MNDADLAYMAGVIDLIGLIRLRSAATGPLPVLQIHGHYAETLQMFADSTETKVIVTSREFARAGCNEHCKDKHIHASSVSARWTVTGAKATVILSNIEPYLKVKQAQARITLSYGLTASYKPATMEKMKALGWSIPVMQGRAA